VVSFFLSFSSFIFVQVADRNQPESAGIGRMQLELPSKMDVRQRRPAHLRRASLDGSFHRGGDIFMLTSSNFSHLYLHIYHDMYEY